MVLSVKPQRGSGRFQWNLGGWLGCVLGGSAWMLVTAGFLLFHGQAGVAAIPLGCFLIANACGVILWYNRGRVQPFSGLMIILAVFAVIAPVAWISTSLWGSPQALEQMNWPPARISNTLVIVLVPAMMAWLYTLEKQARNQSAVATSRGRQE